MKNTGVLISLLIIAFWTGLLAYTLPFFEFSFANPLTYLLIILQTHLYTGIFITAHDAMHATVSANKKINNTLGRLCAMLFAFNFYDNLFKKHHEHHRFVGTAQDPDYHGGNFWIWYYSFAKQYVNIWQILLMAITYNLLKLWFPYENLIAFWIVPSILSTFQLFYFGTYLPHRGEHAAENVHKARSQAKNHLWAFISCYFFGYHYEHHDSPRTPWWKLYREKK